MSRIRNLLCVGIKECNVGIIKESTSPLISHIPLLYSLKENVLRGHVSKANPIGKLSLVDHHTCTAIFQGPSAYISPSWYESKKEGGKVVPTWNYIAVHMIGKCKLIEDSQWIYENVRQLSDQFEKQRNSDWQITDAPANYIRANIRGIYGVEIQVERVDGRFKLSQNRSDDDRKGVIDNLGSSSNFTDRSLAEWMKTVWKK